MNHEPHNYCSFTEALRLHTLVERRRVFSSKFFNELLFNKIDSPTLVNFKIPSHSTRSNITFHIFKATTNYQQYEPIRRLMTSANNYHTFLELLITAITYCFTHSFIFESHSCY